MGMQNILDDNYFQFILKLAFFSADEIANFAFVWMH